MSLEVYNIIGTVVALLSLLKYFNDKIDNANKVADDKIDAARNLVGAKAEEVRKEVEGKVGKVYSRFDDLKTYIEGNFVRSKECDYLHKANSDNFIQIKMDFGVKLDTIITQNTELKITLATAIKQIEINTKRIDKLEANTSNT